MSVTNEPLALFDTPPDRRQVWFCVAVVGVLYLASLPVLAVGGVRLPEIGPFVPTVDAIMLVGEAVTAAFLYSQASVFRSRALAILASGYVYTALLLIPHALSFPGAFAPKGLFGDGVNSPAWFAILRYPAFALVVILYARLKPAAPPAQPETERPAPNIGAHMAAAILLAAAAALLAGSGLLPPLMSDRAKEMRSHVIEYQGALTLCWLAAIVMLWRRRSSVLDLWLLVALAGWLLQSLLNMVEEGRFTVAWYWFFVTTLFSHLVVMLALVAESARLYARLILSMSARTREREARLMSIDALAAAISHEVAQPLSAVGIYQGAGLRSLTGEQPDVDRAIQSLVAAMEAKKLAVDAIKNVGTALARQPGERTTFDLGDLVRETVPPLRREMVDKRISLRLALDAAPSPVLADRAQLQRVLTNLLTNAIDSLSLTEGRTRSLVVRSAALPGRGVVLEINDNGIGVAREDMARIFDPYFTTKANGAGLGLSLSRLIVEEHGGRLWVSRGDGFGVTVHLELPGHA
jgi:signal transduction histidine kinase